MKACLSTTAAFMAATSVSAQQVEEVKPGVFRIPLKKHNPVNHPMLGGWEEAEMWDQKVKNPTNNLSNYMYTMNCQLGTPATGEERVTQQCLFDTTTPVSSTFQPSFNIFSNTNWDSADSTTYYSFGVDKTYTSLGLVFTGVKVQDTFCLGDGDVHITVCMDE